MLAVQFIIIIIIIIVIVILQRSLRLCVVQVLRVFFLCSHLYQVRVSLTLLLNHLPLFRTTRFICSTLLLPSGIATRHSTSHIMLPPSPQKLVVVTGLIAELWDPIPTPTSTLGQAPLQTIQHLDILTPTGSRILVPPTHLPLTSQAPHHSILRHTPRSNYAPTS
jgi:hypothetical protein